MFGLTTKIQKMRKNSISHETPAIGNVLLADRAFEKLIFKSYGQDKNYDRLRHNILNIRQSMFDRHKCFKSMSLKRQFEYCETIGVIAVHTQLQHMNENRPLTLPEDKRYKYSIDRDWQDVNYVELQPFR
jgi:hypothetical protein